MNDSLDEAELSGAGSRRREEILRLALHAVVHRKRRRQVAVAGSCAALAFLASVLVLAPWRHDRQFVRRGTLPHSAPSNSKPVGPTTPPKPKVVIVRVQSDPGLLDRLAIHPPKPAWKAIGDDELLAALAEAGRPAGLEYGSGGEVAVLYR